MLLAAWAPSVSAADSLVWRVKEDRVDAQIEHWSLQQLLPKICKATGWRVYVEPGTTYTVTAKFKDQSSSEALRRLLGRTSFSVVRTNNLVQLYIYNTDVSAATELVNEGKSAGPKDYRLANELVVRMKKGAKTSIDDLAKQLGAKIVGRDDKLGLYRLQFDSAEAANAAKVALQNNSDVAWVDSNYLVDQPDPVQKMSGLSVGGSQLKLDNKDVNPCSPIVGLIDTAVQMQSGYSNYVMNPISVVGDVTVPNTTLEHATPMIDNIIYGASTNPPMILPVIVYKNGESTTTYEVTLGIVAALTNKVSVINLSLGGTGDSASLRQLIQDAQAQGIVFVAAAGNEPVKTPTYPAAWPGVVSVTASDSTGHIADYANSGDFVKAMAPGTSFVTLNGQLWQVEGTSVSAARVSGMIASQAASGCVSADSVVNQVVTSLPVK